MIAAASVHRVLLVSPDRVLGREETGVDPVVRDCPSRALWFLLGPVASDHVSSFAASGSAVYPAPSRVPGPCSSWSGFLDICSSGRTSFVQRLHGKSWRKRGRTRLRIDRLPGRGAGSAGTETGGRVGRGAVAYGELVLCWFSCTP